MFSTPAFNAHAYKNIYNNLYLIFFEWFYSALFKKNGRCKFFSAAVDKLNAYTFFLEVVKNIGNTSENSCMLNTNRPCKILGIANSSPCNN